MTRRLALLAFTLLLVGAMACGKYGPPERAGSSTARATAGAASTHDAAACSDPAHDHGGNPAP